MGAEGGRVDTRVQSDCETRQRRQRPAPVSRPVYAAIDLGTNNCRLLVARSAPGGFRVIDAFSRIVRLGEGVGRSNILSGDAIERTVSALRVCGTKMHRRGVTAARAVATEACRRATNCEQFLMRVKRETGIDIEIITAEEEARLAVVGCTPLLDPGRPYALVFDIGGGSTELMWLRLCAEGGPTVLNQISIPHGVVTLTEEYGGDFVSTDVYRRMIDRITDALTRFEASNAIATQAARGAVQLLGTSGTVTTLAGIHLGLPRYERSLVDGTYLDTDDALAVIRHLLSLDFCGRAAYPCIGRDRADLVIAGCAVFEAICEAWPVDRLRIADRGLREGILVELMAAGRVAN